MKTPRLTPHDDQGHQHRPYLPDAALVVDLQHQQSERHYNHGLDHCQHKETGRVTDQDIRASDRRRQQALERALGPLPQKAHACEYEGEEQHEHGDQTRGNPVQHPLLVSEAEAYQRHYHDGGDNDEGQRAAVP